MASGIIVSNVGNKCLLVPAQHYFYRAFQVGAWSDLTIMFGAAFLKNGTTGGDRGVIATEIKPNITTSKYWFGLKTDGIGFPLDSGQNFWGIVAPALGFGGSFASAGSNGVIILQTITGAGAVENNAVSLGVSRGATTTGLGDADAGETYVNPQGPTPGWVVANASVFNKEHSVHGIRFVKVDSTTLQISAIYYQYNTTDGDTLAAYQAIIDRDLMPLPGKSITVDTVNDVPDAFFVYNPMLNAQLRLGFMAITKNA